MRQQNFDKNNYYLLSSSGCFGNKIFLDEEDRFRFIFLLTHLQSPIRIYNTSWYAKMFIKKKTFSTKKERILEITKNRSVEPLAFVIMPNHFEVLIQNMNEALPSVYMHRILTSYSKYFNSKYEKRGHVFSGPFKATLIKNQKDLLQVSGELHKKPSQLEEWADKYDLYPWSTYQDYLGLNRWGDLVSIDQILNRCGTQAKYREFVSKIKERTLV